MSVSSESQSVASLFDALDELCADEGAGTVVVLAVWAARAAATDGDMVAAAEWAGKAANGLGRLF